MDLEYELMREFDRAVSQTHQAANGNVTEEQDSIMMSVSVGLEGGTEEVKSETLELMNVAMTEQNGVMPWPFPPEDVMTTQSIYWKLDKEIPKFLSKVYQIVDDPTTDHLVHWGFEGRSFVVQDAITFCNVILPKYYKHRNFSSFIRQLNTYGFRKIDCDKWEFATSEFQRGKIHQLKYIKRRTSESKRMGVRSGKHEDTFHKYVKGLSVQISNLSQQVEVSSSIIAAFDKRVQDIELKYKQMACVLAKTIQNPSFVAELIKRKASVEPSERKVVETDDTTKVSSESASLISNHVELQLSVHMTDPRFGESSCSPNEVKGSGMGMVMDDPLESLDNELMNEMEPCEEMGSEKCMFYFHELARLTGADESNQDWVAYAADEPIDKKP